MRDGHEKFKGARLFCAEMNVNTLIYSSFIDVFRNVGSLSCPGLGPFSRQFRRDIHGVATSEDPLELRHAEWGPKQGPPKMAKKGPFWALFGPGPKKPPLGQNWIFCRDFSREVPKMDRIIYLLNIPHSQGWGFWAPGRGPPGGAKNGPFPHAKNRGFWQDFGSAPEFLWNSSKIHNVYHNFIRNCTTSTDFVN